MKHRRKKHRLTEYDYSSPGAYFITVCTKDKRNFFWEDVGASIARPTDVVLTSCGKIVQNAIVQISLHYPSVSVDKYAVMPNHVHLLLQIHAAPVTPSISSVVQQMKGFVTKQVGYPIWQKLFHDHVIRNEQDYQMIWAYIDSNPVRWNKDCFYIQNPANSE